MASLARPYSRIMNRPRPAGLVFSQLPHIDSQKQTAVGFASYVVDVVLVFALQFANYMDDAGPPVGNEVHEKLLEGLSKMKIPSTTA